MVTSSAAGRRWRKWTIIGLLIVGALFGALQLAAAMILPAGIYWAPNSEHAPDPRNDPSSSALAKLGVRHLRVDVGPPAASLSVYRLDPPAAPRATLLVFHGIRDSKSSMLGVGRRMAAAGYRVFLLDSRGHGRSSGRYLSYGVRESRDAQQLLDLLASKKLLVGPVGALGFSYGGSVAIQLAARDRRVIAVSSVATFSSLRAVVPSYVRLALPGLGALVLSSVIEGGIAEAGRVAGFDPARADTVAAIRRASQARFLLLHGSADRRIPTAHSRRLAAAAGARAELHVFKGQTHGSILSDATGAVQRRIALFFARQLATGAGKQP